MGMLNEEKKKNYWEVFITKFIEEIAEHLAELIIEWFSSKFNRKEKKNAS